MILQSTVLGFEGECKPTWINKNQYCIRFTGVTGFFRLVRRVFGIPFRVGEEFHGIVREGGIVESTENLT